MFKKINEMKQKKKNTVSKPQFVIFFFFSTLNTSLKDQCLWPIMKKTDETTIKFGKEKDS